MSKKILFEFDISQILAKLHLGALQAVNQWRAAGFFINSGITDERQTATPEDPGNTKFDLNLKQYEVGYVVDVAYFNDNYVQSLVDKISKLESDFNTSSKPSGSTAPSPGPLLPRTNPEAEQQKTERVNRKTAMSTEQKKMFDDVKKMFFEPDPESKTPIELLKDQGYDIEDKFENFKLNSQKVIDPSDSMIKDITFSTIENISDPQIRDEIFKQFMTALVADLKKMNAAGESNFNLTEMYADALNDAFDGLQIYMKVFAGAIGKKVDKSQVVIQQMPVDITADNYSKYVNDGIIQPATDDDIAKQHAAGEADRKNAKVKLCFKIGYSIEQA